MSDLIEQYNTAKSKLAHYKKLEHDLRLEVIEEIFPNAVEGTHNYYINNLEIKGTFKMNHKLDAKGLAKTGDDLTQAEKECIVYKPSLVVGKYNALDASEREALDGFITTTPALPSLKITTEES